MKQLKSLFSKKPAVRAVAVATMFGSVAANAAYTLPTAATTAFTDMNSAWSAIEAQIWPILAVVVIGFFVIRMFKRGAKQVG
jgi:hypothetical protein